MGYRSKEKYPLLKNPEKKTHCTVDPRRGVPCRVHFHRSTFEKLQPLNLELPEPPSYPLGIKPYKSTVAGYDRHELMEAYNFTVEELYQMEAFPARKDLPPMATEDNEMYRTFQDRDNRKMMHPDVQTVVAVKQVANLQAQLNPVNKALEEERLNPEYPGNNDLMSDLPKSRKYFELLNQQANIMSEQAKLYYTAASALGWDKNHQNENIQWSAYNQPSQPTMTEKASDGVTRTYWTPSMQQLVNAVESHSKAEHVKEAYAEASGKYANLVYKQNQTLMETGTNFRYTKTPPSDQLVQARIDNAIQNEKVRKAQREFNTANIFTRKNKLQKLENEKAQQTVTSQLLDQLEG